MANTNFGREFQIYVFIELSTKNKKYLLFNERHPLYKQKFNDISIFNGKERVSEYEVKGAESAKSVDKTRYLTASAQIISSFMMNNDFNEQKMNIVLTKMAKPTKKNIADNKNIIKTITMQYIANSSNNNVFDEGLFEKIWVFFINNIKVVDWSRKIEFKNTVGIISGKRIKTGIKDKVVEFMSNDLKISENDAENMFASLFSIFNGQTSGLIGMNNDVLKIFNNDAKFRNDIKSLNEFVYDKLKNVDEYEGFDIDKICRAKVSQDTKNLSDKELVDHLNNWNQYEVIKEIYERKLWK